MKRRKYNVGLLTLACLISVFLFLAAGIAGGQASKEKSIAERFHYETSLTWRGVMGDLFRSRPERPAQYKTYPGAKVVKLPPPQYAGKTVEEAVKQRRSVRNYSDKSMELHQLSVLLFAAQGVNGKMYGQSLRTAPSAGALYPMEIYVVANQVQGLAKGLYHYGIREHTLELVKKGDLRKKIVSAGLDQDMLGKADVTFMLSAVFDRCRSKYGERGYRYTYMEAGHISQNIYLQAVSLGLGSVSVGAFLDEKANALAGVDGTREAVLYLHAVGTM